jgi:DNA-binding NarL/FixJ family response regulator
MGRDKSCPYNALFTILMEKQKMNAIPPPDPYEHLLQTLSAMQLQIHSLQAQSRSLADAQAIGSGLVMLEQMTQEMLAVVRSLTDEQTLPELEGRTVPDALSALVEDVAEQLGLSSRISFSGIDEQGRSEEHSLTHTAERLLYLFAREALYQIEQHRETRRLRLTLNYGSGEVYLSLEDDGLPRSDAEESTHSAAPPFATDEGVIQQTNPCDTAVMADLRYRIEQLGGFFDIQQLEERGTRFAVHLPYIPPLRPAVPETAEPVTSPASAPLEQIHVLIVDAQAVIRAGLHHLLEAMPDIQIVGEAADGVQAVSEALELGPQVLLLDAQLPNGQSLEALRQIKQLNLTTRVLLLTTQDREEYLYETLRAGADGYIWKESAAEELARAIRTVASGEVHIQPQLAGKLLSRIGRAQPGSEVLTARELEVLQLLARGMRNKEIAASLYVSERTVNFHLANIYQKLNVSGRTEALSKAIAQGLVKA